MAPSIIQVGVSLFFVGSALANLKVEYVAVLNKRATPSVVPAVGNYKHYGCQAEGSGIRALTPGAFASDAMTVESCASSCAAFTYFGVEYGRECKILINSIINNKC